MKLESVLKELGQNITQEQLASLNLHIVENEPLRKAVYEKMQYDNHVMEEGLEGEMRLHWPEAQINVNHYAGIRQKDILICRNKDYYYGLYKVAPSRVNYNNSNLMGYTGWTFPIEK